MTIFNRVLVPLDGSDWSKAVLPYARLAAKAFDARVTLLHAIDMESVMFRPELVLHEQLESLEKTEREGAEKTLKEAAQGFPGLRAELMVKTGKPADVILKEAASSNAGTLVAMSTHGRRGLQRWLLGSVADRVVRSGAASVLTVRPSDKENAPKTASIKNVLVALDGSPLAEEAIPVAVRLAQGLNAGLQLLRVIPIYQMAYSVEWIRLYETMRGAMEAEVKDYLKTKKRDIRDLDAGRVSLVSRMGDPSEEIIKLAEETADSIIVMTGRGRGGMGRALLGSVADRVVSHSAAPVLLVRSPENQASTTS
jgi:nucleotide-binding universal stress UspA family protein